MPKMTGAGCLADMLQGYGVTHVFMVPAVLRRTFAAMERRTSIKRIYTHGEKSGAYMADGYARAGASPGICMAQVIGALNLAAGLRGAYLAHLPLIAMTGGRVLKTKFRKVHQELDPQSGRAGRRARSCGLTPTSIRQGWPRPWARRVCASGKPAEFVPALH
jgi:acetolactate synthase I/II/III large subunit